MGTVLDLDKRREERGGKAKKVRLDGTDWELPARLPITAGQDLAMGNVRAVIGALFGAKAAAEAKAGEDDPKKGQMAADRATAEVVRRLEPLLDAELLDQVLHEHYGLGDKPKASGGQASGGDTAE